MKPGRLAAGLGVAAGVTLAYATHLYIFHTLRHQPTTFLTQMLEALAHVVGWAALAPIVLRATARPPHHAAGWLRAAPRHLAAAVLVALAQIAVRTVVDETLTHHRSPLADFGGAFTALFTRTFYANVLIYAAVLGGRAFLRAYADRRVRAAELVGDPIEGVGIASTRARRNLSRSAGFDGWPVWSPDGRWILFASNRGGRPRVGELFLAEPDGITVHRISSSPESLVQPTWARDGRIFAAQYTLDEDAASIVVLGVPDME